MPPRRGRRRWHPAFEGLEDRTAPAVGTNIVEIGKLRFESTSDFSVDGTKYEIDGGSLSIGYVPIDKETFHPLVKFDEVGQSAHSITIDANITSPTLTVSSDQWMLSIVAMTSNQAVPIPIWNSPDADTVISIPQLTGTAGVSFSTGDSTAFTVAGCDFHLTSLGFANPDTHTTSNSQALMQGTLDFTKLPLVGEGVTAGVTGANYVIVDSKSITLTGLSVKKTFASKEVAGFAISGEVEFEYSSSSKHFTISGGVVANSASAETTLKNANADLTMTIDTSGQSPNVVNYGLQIGGSFSMKNLSVSTTAGQPLSLQYDYASDTYSAGGSLNVSIGSAGDKQISLNLGNVTAPGIVITHGVLTNFSGTVQEDFQVFGVTFQSPGLTFFYQKGITPGTDTIFQMYGSVDMVVSGESENSVFKVIFGTSQADSGVTIVDGKLTQLDIAIQAGAKYSASGLSLTAFGGGVLYNHTDSGDIYIIYGAFGADFKAFQASIQLGNSPSTGLVIDNGKFSLSDARFTLSNADLGPVVIKNLVVQWDDPTSTNADFSLFVNADVALPGDIEAIGLFEMDRGQVTQIGLTISDPKGVPIPGTNLKITQLGGLVQNINDPSHIVVTVHMDAIYGEPFQFGNAMVNLFRVEGDVTASANELILAGSVLIGAYTTDNGLTWNNIGGEGDAKLTLDWAQDYYNLHMHVAGLFTIFDVTGDLTFRPGLEVDFLATANVVVPSAVPFIGGDTLGGLGFFFQHVFSPSTSTTLAGWINIQVIWDVEVGIEYYVDSSGNSSFSVIGKDQIDNFGREVAPPVNQTYTYTVDLSNSVPAGATQLTFSADWSKPQPGTTVIGKPTFTVIRTINGQQVTTPESAFAGTTMSLITDPLMNTATKKALQVVGSTSSRFSPLQGSYQIQVSVTASGGNPFPNFAQQTGATAADYPDQLKVATTHEVPQPTFGPLDAEADYRPLVQAGPKGTLSVNLAGNMDLALLTGGAPKVSVYLVRTDDVDRVRKLKIASVIPSQSSTPGANWRAQVEVPTFGLDPFPYILYATVDDGRNAPTTSQDSLPFTPEFAFTGNLADQSGVVLPGWVVFLDYNKNGQPDPDEPTTTTSQLGTYGFPPTFDPSTGWANIQVDKDIPVTIVLPSNLYSVAQGNPQIRQYNGMAATSVNFTVERPSTITGFVFNDVAGNGIAADGTPVPGAAVYLDANGNGLLDPGEQVTYADTTGNYQFFNLPNGNFTVRVAPTPPTQAVSAPQGVLGSNGLNYTYGNAFEANQTIEITTLGVFGDGAIGGLREPLTAVLYDAVTRKALATVAFTPSDSGTAIGGFYYKALSQPIHVYAGFRGIIAAYGFGPNQRDGYAGDYANSNQPVPWASSTNNGMISFTGGAYSATPATFPGVSSGNAGSATYAAGTFQFRLPSPISSSTSSPSYNVSITRPFQISSGNDFGLQPPASVGGVVTAAPKLGAAPQPVQGVTVYLYRDGIVVGSAVSGPTGAYSIPDVDPGRYSLVQQVPAGMRQASPVSTTLALSPLPNYLPFIENALTPVLLKPFPWSGAGAMIGVGTYQGEVTKIAASADGLPLAVDDPGVSGIPVGLVFDMAGASSLTPFYVIFENGAVQAYNPEGNILRWYGQPTASAPLPTNGQIGKYKQVEMVDGPGSGASPGAPTFWAALFTDPTGTRSGVGIFGSNTSGPSNPVAYTWDESNPGRMVLADVNGDGIQDVILSGPSTTPTVLLVGLDGRVKPMTIGTLPAASGGFAVAGDINRDGLIDIGVMGSDGALTFSLQGTDGTFAPAAKAQVAAPGSRFTYAGLHDIDSNGWSDLVLVASDPGAAGPSLRVALNDGVQPAWFQKSDQQTIIGLAGDPAVKYTPVYVGRYDYPGANSLPMVGVYMGGNIPRAQSSVLFQNNSTSSTTGTGLSLAAGDSVDVDFENVGTEATDPVVKLPAFAGSGDYVVAYRNGNLEVSDPAIGRLFSQEFAGLRSLTIRSHAGRAGTITIDLSDGPFRLAGGIHLAGAAADANLLRIVGRPTGSSFQVDPAGISVDGIRIADWTGLQRLELVGGPGNDRFVVAGDPGLLGRLTIIGGGGSDIYSLAATRADLAIIDPSGLGTLDFAAATAGAAVDLWLASGEVQHVGAGGNTLALFGPIANVTGTPFADSLVGNALANGIRGLGGDDVIFGNGGDDFLDGGAGNDRIVAGAGRSIILGGDGNDTLLVQQGRNLAIGGNGRDVLVSYPGTRPPRPGAGSLLVGGSTAHDADEAALRSLLREWTFSRSASARLRNILNGRGSRDRANGNIFLNRRSLRPDRSANLLRALPGRDVMFRNARDRFFRVATRS